MGCAPLPPAFHNRTSPAAAERIAGEILSRIASSNSELIPNVYVRLLTFKSRSRIYQFQARKTPNADINRGISKLSPLHATLLDGISGNANEDGRDVDGCWIRGRGRFAENYCEYLLSPVQSTRVTRKKSPRWIAVGKRTDLCGRSKILRRMLLATA